MIPLKDDIPTDRFPAVTVALILANVVVYLLSIRHGGSFLSGPGSLVAMKYGAIPHALTHTGTGCAYVTPLGDPQSARIVCNTPVLAANGIAPENPLPPWQTVFTSTFMHGSLLHIAGNMLFLWIFGNNVEDAMGRVKFIVFYLLGGVAALALQVAISPLSNSPTIGASGAVAAVLGGYVLLYPRARVLTFVFVILFIGVIELPALTMLGAWFLIQAIFGAVGLTHPGAAGGVAYFAHIGGFAFGVLAVRLLATRRKEVSPRIPVY